MTAGAHCGHDTASVCDCSQDTPGPALVTGDEWLGVTIDRRYRLLRVLGRGAMGIVFLAEHLRIGQQVAVKIVRPSILDAAAIRRLELEARLVSLIGHDHIVRMLDFGMTDDGHAYLVMERLSGETLRDRLLREGPLALETSCRILVQVAYALEAAHAARVVHRDIKPENIFLTRQGERTDVVKLLDFGLAALRSSPRSPAAGVRRVVGTPGYISPEQAQLRQVDSSSDVYAFGVTFYEMLCGVRPLDGGSPAQVILRTLHEDPIPPSEVAPDVSMPGAVDEFILSCLRKDPLERPTSMANVRDHLVELLNKLGQPTRRPVDHLHGAPKRQRLAAWVSSRGDHCHVMLAGSLDERSELSQLTGQISAREVAVDLSRITQMNDAGRTTWLDWLGDLRLRAHEIRLQRCPPPLIARARNEWNLFAGSRVESMEVPYYCFQCDQGDTRTVELNRPAPIDFIHVQCGKCASVLTIDGSSEDYVGFAQPFRERRRYHRRDGVLWVNVETGAGSRRLFLSSLSPRGAFVHALQLPAIDSRVAIDFESDLGRAAGTVAHQNTDTSDPRNFGFGVRFDSIPDRYLALVTELKPRDEHTPRIEAGQRRRYPRVPIRRGHHASHVIIKQPGGQSRGVLRNLSMSGALIVTEAPRSGFHRPNITIELHHGNTSMTLPGAIRRRSPTANGLMVAVHFGALVPGVMNSLEELLVAATAELKQPPRAVG